MNEILFGIYPYIALTVLILGSMIRYDRDQFTWKSKSSQLLRRRQLMIGSVLFHAGVLLIFFGHLFGLLTPIRLLDALGVSHSAKQLLAIISGGAAGVIALLGGILLLHRRLADPRIRKHSTPMDNLILSLLLLQLLLGLLTITVSVRHLDGEEMVKLMRWAQGIWTFDPNAASYIADVNILFKLHLFLGLTIFLLFPFSRLVHILSGFSAPVRYLARSGWQIVRSRRQAPLPPRARRPLRNPRP